MKKSSCRVDFSQFGIEKKLRLMVDALLARLFPGKRIVITPDQARIGNKSGFAIFFDNFYWHSFDPSEPAQGIGLINLIAETLGLDFEESMVWASDFIKEQKVKGVPLKKRTVKTYKEKQQKNQKRARQLIADSHSIEGTQVPIYLKERGIPLAEIPPAAKRQLRYYRTPYPYSESSFPALIAIVRDPDDNIVSAFRIYLSESGRTKAPVENAKLALGSTFGAAIHLTPARSWLILTEGLEDGLSVLLAVKNQQGFGVWCCIGGNLPSIVIPKDIVRCVVLAVDNDAGGRGFIKELAPRLIREGFRVFTAVPSHGKDFNEMLCRYGRLFKPDMMEEYHD